MGGTPPVRYLPCVVPCKLYFVMVKIIMPEIKEMYKINKRCESNEFRAFYKEKFNCSLGNYKLNGI